MKYYREIKKWTPSTETKFDSNKKVDNRIHTIISVDSEFQTYLNKTNLIITNQLNEKIYEHPSLGLKKLEIWNTNTAISHYLNLKDEIKDYNNNSKSLVVHLLIFYSPTDILSLFKSSDIIYKVLNSLKQDRRIKSDNKWATPIHTGISVFDENGFERMLYIQIHDASGLTGPTSLKNLASSLGVSMPDKETFSSEEKGRMLEMYKIRFNDFIDYSLGDTKVLNDIFYNYTKLWQTICFEMGIKQIEPTYTAGSNTSKVIENIVEKKLLNLTKTSEFENVSKIKHLIRNEENKPIESYKELFLSLNFEANYNYLFDKKSETKQYLALCDGGRCKSERPKDINAQGILVDIDISGCYANGLLNQVYPVGLPTILDVDKKYLENRMSLGEFLNSEIFEELLPGLWYARISTKEDLSFSQDLIISKIPPDRKKKGFVEEDDFDESEELLGISILLLKEIKNGALNHDLLQILKSVSSNLEWKELKEKILIDSIIFYPKNTECKTVEELVEKTISCDKGIKRYIGKNWSIKTDDERSRYWIGLSMADDWMEKLIKLRNSYPKETPQNTIYKLVNNSTYGVIASHYFDVGNVVVSNNITARARSLAYLMAKGLGIYQSITDGGIFNAEKVNFWNKTPSLNTLTFINEQNKLSRKVLENLSIYSLGKQKWFLDSDKKEISELSWKHLQNLFPKEIDILNKGEKGQFSFEVKHVFEKASFQSQANYLIDKPVEGKHPVKARGYELKKTLFLDPNGEKEFGYAPIVDCLEKILEGETVPPYPPVYKSSILRITEWQRSEETNQRLSKDLLPGDSYARRSWLRPISLSMFRWQTWAQYQRWTRKHDSLRERYGYGVESGYLDQDGSVRYRAAVIEIQDAIDDGLSWYRSGREAAKHHYLDQEDKSLQLQATEIQTQS